MDVIDKQAQTTRKTCETQWSVDRATLKTLHV